MKRFESTTVKSSMIWLSFNAPNVVVDNTCVSPRVNMDEFRSFNLILPPLSLQTQFSERIERIEAQKELIKQNESELKKHALGLFEKSKVFKQLNNLILFNIRIKITL